MWYLFMQIWIWLLAAFILGWFAHWFFCCRNLDRDVGPGGETGGEQLPEPGSEAVLAETEDAKPTGFSDKPEVIDDLKRIKGIGAVIEETLNSQGIYQFKQIAAWSDDNVQWVEGFLSFPGRIDREEWRSQAQALGMGEDTEFSTRVDAGKLDYD